MNYTKDINEMDDAEIYRVLVSSRPEGKVMLTPQEKAAFEDWMDKNADKSR